MKIMMELYLQSAGTWYGHTEGHFHPPQVGKEHPEDHTINENNSLLATRGYFKEYSVGAYYCKPK